MQSIGPSIRWNRAFQASCLWLVAFCVGLVVFSVHDLVHLTRSRPALFYPWFMIHYGANAVFLVALLSICSPSLDAWLRPRWGRVVAAVWLVGMALGMPLRMALLQWDAP